MLKMMKETMSTSYYHISLTNDVIGLESAVALKNAYALGVAMTIGLVNRENGENAGLHYNSQAGAFYQATKEMSRLLKMQGASEDSTYIGIGDLYVTVYGGRTRKIDSEICTVSPTFKNGVVKYSFVAMIGHLKRIPLFWKLLFVCFLIRSSNA